MSEVLPPPIPDEPSVEQRARDEAMTPESTGAVELASLRSLSLKERVMRQLRGLIEEGAWAPGQQLPSERELAERLSVSRSTVREAVQFLHALGLVEVRHGTGTFVRPQARDRAGARAEWRLWTQQHSGRVRDILEVRRGLESFAAELAASRASANRHAAIAEAMRQVEDAVDSDDVAELVAADVAFHHAFVAAAGNAALLEFADALGQQLLRERAATLDTPGRSRRSLEEHHAIADAIIERDGARARGAVLAHLTSVEADIEPLLRSTRGQGVTTDTEER